jgi:hypothetical protein
MRRSSLGSPWWSRFPILSSANASPYVATLEEVGSNVVATGSGAFDATGLTLSSSDFGFASMPPQMEPNRGMIATGANGSASAFKVSTLTGPSSFGSGGFFYGLTSTPNPTGTGPLAGISGTDLFVYLPYKYANNTPLSHTATYHSATFATLGVTPGTYFWTWGSGVNQSFTLEVVQTPPPNALRLLGLLGWRGKRKA